MYDAKIQRRIETVAGKQKEIYDAVKVIGNPPMEFQFGNRQINAGIPSFELQTLGDVRMVSEEGPFRVESDKVRNRVIGNAGAFELTHFRKTTARSCWSVLMVLCSRLL
jgi:hypothetical protein